MLLKLFVAAAVGLALLIPEARPTPPAIRGRVQSAEGQPISGIHVLGSKETCCPIKVEGTETDESGRFLLTDPGEILYFRDYAQARFWPLTKIMQAGETEVFVVLEAAERSNLIIPTCSSQKEPGKRVGDVFRFLIPKGAKMERGHDIDYAWYSIRSSKPQRWLRIMSGPLVGGSSRTHPPQLLESSTFEERWVVHEAGGRVGIDSMGRAKNGKKWRNLDMSFSEAAWYDDVGDQTAAFFDTILDTVCLAAPPPPEQGA